MRVGFQIAGKEPVRSSYVVMAVAVGCLGVDLERLGKVGEAERKGPGNSVAILAKIEGAVVGVDTVVGEMEKKPVEGFGSSAQSLNRYDEIAGVVTVPDWVLVPTRMAS